VTEPLFVVLAGVIGAVCALGVVALPRGGWGPSAVNYRGVTIPVILGAALVMGVLGGVLAILLVGADTGAVGPRVASLAGLLIVFLAGLYDDYRAGPGRGLRGHVRELLRGHVTTGIIKLISAALASVAVAMASHASLARSALAVPVIAGSANLWNLLDLAPARALKFFLPATVALAIAGRGTEYLVIAVAALAAAASIFPFDLKERAMLGDAGSNVLGFVVGVGLFRTLSVIGLAAALGAILLLHVLAETVRLSRIIAAVPPLRWFDLVGRRASGEGHR
jgi:UDP-GlcNAc:undecaprenyl-phosphate GlcNAc-1-phosphate transferase